MITLNAAKAAPFYRESEIANLLPQLELATAMLDQGSGPGSEFLGWNHLPSALDEAFLADLEATAARLSALADVFIVIGIGGSYLGARAVIDALSEPLRALGEPKRDGHPLVVYAGHHLSGRELTAVEALIEHYDVAVNVISKSGTTTEPAIAFRRIKTKMEAKYGAGAAERIIATTDASRGALRQLATESGYKTYVVPDDIGGRFSVLTAVGLLPIAVAGVDIRALVNGARAAELHYQETALPDNAAANYAAIRTALLRRGYQIEVLVNYEPALQMVAEWWKQLYGESEGKDGRGLFPASLSFTTDLHSLGQYVQDGRRVLFETVLDIRDVEASPQVPATNDDLDGLNYLAGRTLADVNRRAMEATMLAHVDGGVPNVQLVLDRLDAENLGWLIYFFERACALSGYLNAVNPFDQPGVEAYKQNMFALLGKPGFEAQRAELEARL